MPDYSARRTLMVDTQVRPSDVTKFPIIDAMLSVPRETYAPNDRREAAYLGENLTLKSGRVMLEPRTFAKMLDALDVQPEDAVLDIGCGLGYSTAVLARLGAMVIAVESDAEMAAEAQETLSGENVDNAAVIEGSLAAGASDQGPYDVILLQGGAETVPVTVTDQLKDGGRIAVVFMEGVLGVCRIGLSRGGKVTWRDAFNASAPVLPGFEMTRAFAL